MYLFILLELKAAWGIVLYLKMGEVQVDKLATYITFLTVPLTVQ